MCCTGDVQQITKEEVRLAWRRTKNSEVVIPDAVPVKAQKCIGESAIREAICCADPNQLSERQSAVATLIRKTQRNDKKTFEVLCLSITNSFIDLTKETKVEIKDKIMLIVFLD